ncbi:odorant receptor 67c-like [Aphidius gifuensis]|uniref:odorant receptor 67c-like n=1 Tax=Aphidius gifuensis TaxID=684658 RepID=UPI001CDB7042|nr:odorant receptor 67c-like [Aphidius gifuensis]
MNTTPKITQGDFDDAMNVFDWTKIVSSFFGIWPLKQNKILSTFWLIYLIVNEIIYTTISFIELITIKIHINLLRKIIEMAKIFFIAGLGPIAAHCLLVTIVCHISGKLSVLAVKIMKINPKSFNLYNDVREIFIEHDIIIKLVENNYNLFINILQQVFSVILLFYVVGPTLLICLIGYKLLITVENGENIATILEYILYIIFLLFSLYTHCVIGESLVIESENICEAYYHFRWYDLPNNIKKYFILGILRSQKSLCLTFGEFGVFDLQTMMPVLQTSMGYLSVLRSFLNHEK